MGNNISVRRQAGQELLEDATRFRAIFEQAAAGIVQTDLSGRFLSVNPRFSETLGWTRDELLQKNVRDITHPDDLTVALGQFQRAIDEHECFDIEMRCLRKDGTAAWFASSISPIPDASGRPKSLIVVSVDISLRKRAEEAARESEEQFRAFLENSATIAWMKDADGRHVYASGNFERRFGIQLKDWREKSDRDLWPRKLADEFRKNDRTVLSTWRAVEVVEEARNPDGSSSWWLNCKFPFRNAAGQKFVGGLGVDITDRKVAEVALRKSYDLLAKVSRQVPGVIYQFQLFPDGRSCFPYASEGIRQIYEVTPEQVREDASAVFAILHPDDRQGVAASIRKSALTLKPWLCEYRVVLPRQGVRWRLGDSRPEKLADGSILWHGFITDITDRKRAEAEIRESDQRFRQIAENIHEVFWLRSADGQRFLYVNPAYKKIWGRTIKSLMENRDSWFDAIHPEDRARVRAELRSIRRTRRFNAEYRIVRPDGSIRWIRDFGTQIRDESGRVCRIAGTAEDITRRKLAEEELRRLNADLEKRVALRTAALMSSTESLLTTVTELQKARTERLRLEQEVIGVSESEQERIGRDLHDDLGQQLAGIRWLGSVLQKDLGTRSAPEAAGAARIVELLSDALRLTRSLARGLHPVPSEPAGLMSALNELAGRTSELFKVQCRFTCPRPVHVGHSTTATHLYRIAQEAVTNAVKHGKAKRIEITLSFPRKQNLLLSVSDNGRGLKKRGRGNEGFGMRIMNYRAEILGGSLDFQNMPGRGTRLLCTLPVSAKSTDRPGKAADERR